jgi:hypothetical protein
VAVRTPVLPLERLLRERLIVEEDPSTADLIARLRPARARGYLTKGELERVCRWKSPRTAGLVRLNNHHRVRQATTVVLAIMDERERFDALLALHGISVPSASAVLTMLEPKCYGVIDIRVWQILHAMGAVEGNAAGAGFTFDQWLQFLHVIRDLAARLDVSARAVERTLFAAHREHQVGTLYRASNATRS